jgi:uncharacterized protein
VQYEDLIESLTAAGLPLSPAECHGNICGLICAGGAEGAHAWLGDLLDSATGSAPQVNQLRSELSQIAGGLAAELADPLVVSFEPLLPDEDQDLFTRTEALASWAESFLGALGLGGLASPESLSDEAQEALEDLAEIAKLECDDAGSEELEAALMEVHEYLRVVVQLLYAELAGDSRGEVPEDATLH